MVEQRIENPRVTGSIPVQATKIHTAVSQETAVFSFVRAYFVRFCLRFTRFASTLADFLEEVDVTYDFALQLTQAQVDAGTSMRAKMMGDHEVQVIA